MYIYIYICAVCVVCRKLQNMVRKWCVWTLSSRHLKAPLGVCHMHILFYSFSYYTLSQKIYVTLPLFFVKLIQKRTDFSDFWHRNPKTFHSFSRLVHMPSVLWRCWLGSRKGVWSVKTEWWGVGVVVCLERDADLHMAQLIPLPLTFSCLSKIQIGFYLSGTGSPM